RRTAQQARRSLGEGGWALGVGGWALGVGRWEFNDAVPNPTTHFVGTRPTPNAQTGKAFQAGGDAAFVSQLYSQRQGLLVAQAGPLRIRLNRRDGAQVAERTDHTSLMTQLALDRQALLVQRAGAPQVAVGARL